MIQPDAVEHFQEKHGVPVEAPPAPPRIRGQGKSRISESPESLRAYLEKCDVKVSRIEQKEDKCVLILDGCPMNPDHGHGSDTAVVWRPPGMIGFSCQHDTCRGYNWKDVRAKIDPGYDQNNSASGAGGGGSQADMLVGLAQEAELFHTSGGHDSEGYATIEVNGHRETWQVNHKGFRRWLARQFYMLTGKAPNAQAMQDALGVIAGMAIYDGPECEVAVRLAEHKDSIYLDLVDCEWRAVRINKDGWTIVDHPPVRFIRKRGMLPIPAPVQGGDIRELREFVNLPDDSAWVLFLAWLVMALCPRGPYPILVANGEQGSAKSSLCRYGRSLIDPNKAPLRRPPREERDLMIAADNSWIVGYDNLSGLPPYLSDCLCALATGGGFAARELYSDADERIFTGARPIMLNGIDDICTRSDLLDRALTFMLPKIAKRRRREERKLDAAFEAARPRILGALLTAVSTAMRNLPNVDLPELPRMADFAKWATAAEAALGLSPGEFMKCYSENQAAGHETAIESSKVGLAVRLFMQDHECWSGSCSKLLALLESALGWDEDTKRPKGWPETGCGLSAQLRRLAPNLRGTGVAVEPPEKKDKTRTWTLTRMEPESTAQTARPPEDGGEGAEIRAVAESPIFNRPTNRPTENGSGATENTVLGGSGGLGGLRPTHSGPVDEEDKWVA